MSHNTISCFMYWLCVVMLTACSDDSFENAMEPQNQLMLSFTCYQPKERSSEYEEIGEEKMNENLIETLDCFFYLAGDGTNIVARHHLHLADLAGQKTKEITTELKRSVVTSLFPDGATTCKIYAIANLPAGVLTQTTNTSIEGLKSINITSNLEVKTEQPSFIMDSSGTNLVTFNKSNNTLTSSSILLKRMASKIRLLITSVESSVTDKDGITWKPAVDGMKVMFRNGSKKSAIDADMFPPKPLAAVDENRIDYEPESAFDFKRVNIQINGEGHTEGYKHKIPFYSYACNWEENVDEAYLLLVVPWQKQNDDRFRACYYQIPINSDTKQLRRNQYYKINLTVSTLGSFDPIVPTKLQPNYTILDWATEEVKLDADLQNYRYLIVTPTKYVIRNQDELIIPYVTSHPVKISSLSLSHKDFSSDTPKDIVSKALPEQIPYNQHLFLGADQTIVYKNLLQNDFSKANFDLSPYFVRFTVEHTDNPAFRQDVEIIQYPAIYADYETNSNYVEVGPNGNYNNKHGYVFVNGYQEESVGEYDFFGSAHGINGGSDSPNMYVFTVTSVKGTDYIIGDPREKTPSLSDAKVMYNKSHLGQPAWARKKDLSNKIRGLENYYATDGSEASMRVIAPKFRLASSYSMIELNAGTVKTLDQLKKRCASYQEDGYPAGRWRLPTRAEFEFIITLVNNNKLPKIYVLDRGYWCAHGVGTPSKKGDWWYIKWEEDQENGDGYSHSVRCVYDEWYWGSGKIPKEEFRWGDRAR